MNLKAIKKFRKDRYILLNWIIIFWSMTIILYVYGPIKWRIPSYFKLLTFLIVYNISFYIGYKFYYFNKKIQVKYKKENIKKIEKIIIISSIFNIVSNIMFSYYFSNGISLTNILNPGKAYQNLLLESINFSKPFLIQFFIRIITYLFCLSYFYYPLGLYYYKKLSRKTKGIYIVSLLTTVVYYLNLGTFKGLGDLMFIYLGIFLIKSRIEKKKLKNKAGMFLLAIVLFSIFSFFQSERKKIFSPNSLSNNLITNSLTIDFVEKESISIPKSIKSAITYFNSGYTGLAYSLEVPFEWTYGFGNSRAASEYLLEYSGINLFERNYLSKIEKKFGWKNGALWSTTFAWFASDVTFYGIPVLMFLFGYFIAKLWKEIYFAENIISIVMYSRIIIAIFFISGNNQLFQSRTSFFGTIGIIIIYCFRKITIKR